VVEIEAFLGASESVRFAGQSRTEIYGWVQGLLGQQEYPRQGRRAKELLRAYVAKMTGLSLAQVTRLISRYVQTGRVAAVAPRRHRFPRFVIGTETDCPGQSAARVSPNRYSANSRQ
jgi:hypothetical protein